MRNRLFFLGASLAMMLAGLLPMTGWSSEDVEPPFSLSGVSVTDFGINDDKAYDLAVQDDGKIVVAGTSNNSSDDDMAVARYLQDGSLDPEFNSDGRVTFAVGNGDDAAYSVAIQKDGKIVLAGSTHNGTDTDFAVVRLTKEGYFDKEFDGDGDVVISFGSGNDVAYRVMVLDDGRIIVAGVGEERNGRSYAVARLNPDGSIDKSFGDDGKVILAEKDAKAAYAMVLQDDGKIILGGYVDVNGIPQAALFRLQKDGRVDQAFGEAGLAIAAPSSKGSAIYGLALQDDKKINAAGYSSNGEYRDMLLARLNGNGSLDMVFGSKGTVVAKLGYDSVAYSVAIRSDRSIVSVGFGSNNDNKDVVLIYYNSEGGIKSTSIAASDPALNAGQEER